MYTLQQTSLLWNTAQNVDCSASVAKRQIGFTVKAHTFFPFVKRLSALLYPTKAYAYALNTALNITQFTHCLSV